MISADVSNFTGIHDEIGTHGEHCSFPTRSQGCFGDPGLVANLFSRFLIPNVFSSVFWITFGHRPMPNQSETPWERVGNEEKKIRDFRNHDTP